MGNTPNNNFPYPESSGLVKDGWEDIKDLADSIDTKLGVYSTPGMVKLASVAFSAVASVSLPQDTFTSTYDNYSIKVFLTGNATTIGNMRLRASGADNTTSNYWFSAQGLTTNGTTENFTGDAGTAFQLVRFADQNGSHISLDIFTPNVASRTTFGGVAFGNNTDGARFLATRASGAFNASTVFDSLTIYPTAGNITGSISCYGYNK
jgi:hypothetical protein